MEIGKNVALVVLVIALLGIGSYLYINTSFDRQTISVSGNSEIDVKPDFVSVYINIENNDKSAQVAKDQNSLTSSKVVEGLKSLGFKDDEIETISYNIYPDYTYTDGTQKPNGYKAVNQIRVKMTDYQRVGLVVDSVVDNGALIQYISFELTPENESKYKAMALENATLDTKSQAEAIARGAGKKLGKLVSINTGSPYYYPFQAYAKAEGTSIADNAAGARQAAVNINPQELKVYANVQAVYALR